VKCVYYIYIGCGLQFAIPARYFYGMALKCGFDAYFDNVGLERNTGESR
jgi:hypothetical protein